MSEASVLVHATCVALPVGDSWQGVLMLGPSSSGKSDLALRLIDGGARLVADDQVRLGVQHGALEATCPPTIAGRIEARGLGLLALPASQLLDRAIVVAVVELRHDDAIERLPDPPTAGWLGIDVPRWQLAPFEASAPAKLRLGVEALATARGTAAVTGSATALPQDSTAGPSRRPAILVTGLSGAGRASALKALEDLGYVALDNMPVPLIEPLLRPGDTAERYPVAIGVDVRTWGFDGQAVAARLEELRHRPDLAVSLVFLDCDTDVLLRRYTETRRPHPLAQDRPVQDAIADERRRLAVLRDAADRTIDTSVLAPHELKRLLGGHFALDASRRLRISIVSFSFRRGLPREADLVFDARFLRNPHYVAALRPLDGRDTAVRDYVAADPGWAGFLQRLEELLVELLPRFDSEGKTYLTIAIGCTGGRHRSVAVANELAVRLRQLGRDVAVSHRDVALATLASGTANSAAAVPFPVSSSQTAPPEGVR